MSIMYWSYVNGVIEDLCAISIGLAHEREGIYTWHAHE